MNSKRRMAVGLVAAVAGLAVVAGLFHNRILSALALRSLKQATGLELRIERMDTRWLRPTLQVTGLTILNPAGFPPGEALRVEQFYAEYDRASLFGDAIHFKEIRMDMPRIVLVRNEQGETNLGAIGAIVQQRRQVRDAGRPPARPEVRNPPAGAGPDRGGGGGGGGARTGRDGADGGGPAPVPEKPAAPAYRIDKLTVGIGTIEVRNYEKGVAEPASRTLELHVSHTLENVTDLNQAGTELATALAIKSAPTLIEEASKMFNDLKESPQGQEIEQQLKDLKKAWKKLRTGS